MPKSKLDTQKMEQYKTYISEFLKNTMSANDLSISQLAETLEVSSKTIYNYLEKINLPKTEELILMAENLNFDFQEMIKNENQRSPIILNVDLKALKDSKEIQIIIKE